MTILLTFILGLIALLHLAWALRIWFPIREEAALARAVVGAKGIAQMPNTAACLFVVLALAVVVAALWLQHFALARLLLLGATLVFLVRGAVAYTPIWRRITPEEPFRSNDARFYAPLCLLIGVMLLLVLFGG
ncbi:MAG: DUF3995 domain-containing protein [Pseudomonadota bacterium]